MTDDLLYRYPALKPLKNDIDRTVEMLVNCFSNGGKLMICGNGGSCADAEHIVGELMKGFLSTRPLAEKRRREMKNRCPQLPDSYLDVLQEAVPAISLSGITALNTAFCNDADPELVYAQCLMGLGKKGDILLCISTSGNSKNVFAASLVAKSLGIKVVGLTGMTGGRLGETVDICLCVPETETYKVQELHLPVYHYICAMVEKRYFKADKTLHNTTTRTISF